MLLMPNCTHSHYTNRKTDLVYCKTWDILANVVALWLSLHSQKIPVSNKNWSSSFWEFMKYTLTLPLKALYLFYPHLRWIYRQLLAVSIPSCHPIRNSWKLLDWKWRQRRHRFWFFEKKWTQNLKRLVGKHSKCILFPHINNWSHALLLLSRLQRKHMHVPLSKWNSRSMWASAPILK